MSGGKVFKGILIVLAAVGLIGNLLVETASHPPAAALSFAKTMDQKVGVGEQLLVNLETCMKACPPADAALSKRLFKTMSPMVKGDVSFDKILPDLFKIVIAAVKTYDQEDDGDNLVLMYQSAYGLVMTTKGTDLEDPNFVKLIESGVASFTDRFPKIARGYGLKAAYLATVEAKKEDVIAAYRKCIELDPADAPCRQAYAQSVEAYEEIRCLGENVVEGFGIYLADSSQARFSKKLPLLGKNKDLFVASRPSLTRKDIKEIYPNQNHYGQTSLSLVFTKAGRMKLAKVTGKNINKLMAVVVDNQILIAPTIQSRIDTDSAQVSFAEADKRRSKTEVLEQVCTKTTQLTLPKELRL